MTVTEEKRNKLYEEGKALVEKAKENSNKWSDEDRAKYQEVVAEIRSLDEQIKAENEIRSLEMKKPAPAAQKEPAANGTQKDDETRAFENFIRQTAGQMAAEKRDTPVNMTYGANGAVIPDTIWDKVIDRVVQISPLFALAAKYSIKGDITIPKIDRTDGNITVAFQAEFSQMTANGFKFSSVTLSGHLAAALVLVSKQLINNSKIDVVDVVINKMAEEVAIFVENFLLNGKSDIANSGIKNSIDSGNILSVASVAALTGDNLIDLQDQIPDSYQPNAGWIMSSTVRTKVRKLKDGQGNYLMIPDFQRGSGYLLLGKPVYISDNMPTASAAVSGNNIIYYGDFSGLAVKTGESAEIEVLREAYATQHALGLNVWFEIDSTIENTQKIAALALS